jgi:hypothetical protein
MSPVALTAFALLAALTLGGVAVGWRARLRTRAA